MEYGRGAGLERNINPSWSLSANDDFLMLERNGAEQSIPRLRAST